MNIDTNFLIIIVVVIGFFISCIVSCIFKLDIFCFDDGDEAHSDI